MEMPFHALLKGGSWEPINKIEHKFIGLEDLLAQDKLLRLSW